MILALVMACAFMPGCFIEYDTDKDFQQVAVVLDSYTITDPTGAKVDGQVKTYQTEKITLKKYQVATFVNQYYTYIAQGYYTVEQLVEEMMYQQILINSAKAYKEFGLIRWSQYEEDMITEYKYTALDNYIESQKEAIYDDRGEDYIPSKSESEEEESESTTYPVFSDDAWSGLNSYTYSELMSECFERGILTETPEYAKSRYELIKLINDDLKSAGAYAHLSNDELKTLATEKAGLTTSDVANMTRYALIKEIDDYYYSIGNSYNYEVSMSRIPGISGTEDEISLEREALVRTIAYLKEVLEDNETLTAEETAKVKDSFEVIDDVRKNKGTADLYNTIATSYAMEIMVGESYREQILVNLLQEYIESTVSVSDNEVVSKYTTMLADQKAQYSANESAYVSAMDSNTTVLYHPQTNAYFIKHILIPFTAEQTAELNSYSGSASQVELDNMLEYRDRLASNLIGYAHVDGEDDKTNPLTIDQIASEISSKVNSASTMVEKDRIFSELVYKYSTDSGSIERRFGYSESKEFADGEKSTYVEEFAAAAKELYEKGELGAVSGKVVTNYGVHILMLVRTNNQAQTIGLDDYASTSDRRTVRQILTDEIYNTKLSAIFSNWTTENLRNNYKSNVKNYTSVYSNIVEEMINNQK